ncbi:MAG: zf-HC2 domain-containing protein [Chloroflexi bacterium]|jgi:hypothetical protein|nr:zf-HC2 domain-containing protein [Chloroflexota bacterium]
MFGQRRQSACERIQDMLSPYIDGRATSVERDAVEFHVDVCEECRFELGSMKKTAQLLHRMPLVSTPRSFTLAEVPARGFALPFRIPSTDSLRLATATAIIALVAMVGVDISGVADKATDSSVPETSATIPTPEQSILEIKSPPATPENGSEIDKDTMPPLPTTPVYTGVAGNADGDNVPPVGPVVNPEREAIDPRIDGAREGLSPTPSRSAPFWLNTVEIVSGVFVALLGGMYFLAWQRKRSRVSTDKG